MRGKAYIIVPGRQETHVWFGFCAIYIRIRTAPSVRIIYLRCTQDTYRYARTNHIHAYIMFDDDDELVASTYINACTYMYNIAALQLYYNIIRIVWRFKNSCRTSATRLRSYCIIIKHTSSWGSYTYRCIIRACIITYYACKGPSERERDGRQSGVRVHGVEFGDKRAWRDGRRSKVTIVRITRGFRDTIGIYDRGVGKYYAL